jgi:hypothetical protein
VPNEALASIKHKGKALTGRSTTCLALSELIAALNPVLRGWTTYYQHVSAKRTFGYLDYYVWWRVGRWLRKKHPGLTWKQLNQRYLNDDYTYAGSRARALQTGADTDHSVPLPGSANPDTVDPDASQPAAVARQARQPRRTTGARDRPAGARMKQTPLRVLMESRMR